MWSTASFEAPYGLVGEVGADSTIGTCSGSPYVAAVEEKTSVRTPASRIAASRAIVPPTLLSQYFSGFTTDSPTCENAAKCRTPSKEASSHLAASRMSPSMKAAPAGTPSRKPVERLSRTTTS